MKRYFALVLLVLNLTLGFADNYSKADKQASSTPSNLKTVAEIGQYLTQNLTSDTEKARAIYYWVSHNIQYNVAMLTKIDDFYIVGERNILDEVLKDKKGVCQHYSVLFDALCQYAGIKSYIIAGITSQNGTIANLSHSWNAVYINGNYYLVDATWAAGNVTNGKFKQEFNDSFFLISPSEFIKTHIPFDPIWQFLDNPITQKEFEKADFSKLKTRSNFNFNDSIKENLQLDSMIYLIRENSRIRKYGTSNKLTINYMACNQQNILQLRFNKAAKTFNKGIENYNIYIMNKNKQFNNPDLEDNQILEMLAAARSKIENAEADIKFINSEDNSLMKNVVLMQNSISDIKKSLDEEDKFLKKYIKTWKPLRLLQFYRIK